MNLQQTDPKIAELIKLEEQRQESTLELIASENHVSRAVQEAAGTVLTNKYAEGYPGARYYGGCAYYDQIETLAIDRAKQLFNCRFANVQPHSGANANLAAFMAMMQPGDRFLSINLSSGGHLSHGMKLNTSAIFYKPDHYELDPKTETIDFNSVRAKAREIKPKMILCGYSAYRERLILLNFAPSPMKSALCSSPTWPTSPGSASPAFIPRRSLIHTSSPRPLIRHCAARAAD